MSTNVLRHIRIVMCLFLLFAAQTMGTAETYFVSPTGNDTFDGLSETTAWATIDNGDFNGVLAPGDTVVVLAGTYDVSKANSIYSGSAGPMLVSCSGADGDPITYRAEGTVIIDRGNNGMTAGGDIAFKIGGISNIVLDGFWIKGGTRQLQMEYASNIEVKNCKFTSGYVGGWEPGAYFFNSSGIFFHNNVMEVNPAARGIGVLDHLGGGLSRFYNNTIVNAVQWGFSAQGKNQVEFKNNIIYNCAGTGIHALSDTSFVNSHNVQYMVSTAFEGQATQWLGEKIANPKFVDAAAGNYSLQAGSPAIDTGTVVGLPYKGLWPDAGAFETDGAAPTTMSNISGKVSDFDTGSGISGVVVSAGENGNSYATTDADGNYSLQTYEGSKLFTASKGGYEADSKTVVVVAGSNIVNFVLAAIQPTNTYYVNPNGNDNYSGTRVDRPWKSVSRGDMLGVLKPGDTVIVQAGTYNLNVIGVSISHNSGEAGNPITYKAESGAILDRSVGGGAVVLVTGVHDIVLDGFNIKGGDFCLQTEGASNVEIKNCRFSGNSGGWNPTVYLHNSTDLFFHHNVVDQGKDIGIGVLDHLGGGLSRFYNNVIAKSNVWAFSAQGKNQVEFKNNIVAYANQVGIHASSNTQPLVNTNNIVFQAATPYGDTAVQGSNDTADDPKFFDAVAGDYRLSIGSPAIDTGVGVGLAFNGPAPDRGAFETPAVPTNGGTVSGKVTTTAGEPIADAIITWSVNGSELLAKTNASGDYSLKIASGTQTLVAARRGFTSKTDSVNVPANGTATLNLQLDRWPGKTYYVSPSGNDGNDGLSEATAWARIDAGENKGILIPGDKVIVLSGTYTLTDVPLGWWNGGAMFRNCSGAADAPITYQAQTKWGVTLACPPDGSAINGTVYVKAHYLTFDGFIIKGSWGAAVVQDATGTEIKNCRLIEPTVSAVYVLRSTGTKFHHNICTGYETVQDDSSAAGGNNTYFNNTVVGGGECIKLNGCATGTMTVKNNILVGSGVAGFMTQNLPMEKLSYSHNQFNLCTNAESFNGTVYIDPIGANESTLNAMIGDDYGLMAGSPCIDTGIDVGLPFEGLAPDRGAREYDGPTPVVCDAIGDIFKQGDLVPVKLTGSVVTVAKGDFTNANVIYVEDENRAAGVRVRHISGEFSASAKEKVSVIGYITTENGERSLIATSIGHVADDITILPLGMPNRSVIGAGLSSEGLLVKIWGKVGYKAPDGSYFCVDDGSSMSDGMGNMGIPVVLIDAASIITVPTSPFVSITGVVSIQDFGGGKVAVVRPRYPTDIN